ncbi:MAG: nucleotide sugar dehydrogenase [Candidatus Polarisedimenticolia bacterium]
MRVSVFGLGYVGCVTAVCLAKAGHRVIGVDVDPGKVSMLNDATPPVIEPGLADLLPEVVGSGRLRATTDAAGSVGDSEVALVCVGTPGGPGGRIDPGAVERVGREIARALRAHPRPYTVVLRSTVLPGTTRRLLLPALREAGEAAPRIAVNPEFMREGTSLGDFAHPPFTLAGCRDEETAALIRCLYAGVEAPFVRTTIETAEMIKYVSNAFHALKVCFANEVGDVSEALGVDPGEVMRIVLMDRKLNVSEAYLRPGFAFGGSCLPKDLRALLHAAREADLAIPLLSAILPSNEGQIRRAVGAVLATRRRRVGLVGLSFKPGTDDLRESPLVGLAETLIGKGIDLRILDRSVMLARLVGANRRYIEEEIPHIASLMCGEVGRFLDHAEVVVIGKGGEETRQVVEAIEPRHLVIDLTRSAPGVAARADGPVAASVEAR